MRLFPSSKKARICIVWGLVPVLLAYEGSELVVRGNLVDLGGAILN